MGWRVGAAHKAFGTSEKCFYGTGRLGEVWGNLSKAEDAALKAARLEAGWGLAAADLTDTHAGGELPTQHVLLLSCWVGTNGGIPAGLGSGTAAPLLLDPPWFRCVSVRLHQRPGRFWPRRSQTFPRFRLRCPLDQDCTRGPEDLRDLRKAFRLGVRPRNPSS